MPGVGLVDGLTWCRARRRTAAGWEVETVNRALSEIAARRARLAFLDDLDEAAADLADPEVMGRAWH
jgi:hypothetical protein